MAERTLELKTSGTKKKQDKNRVTAFKNMFPQGVLQPGRLDFYSE
jgi:hypothetical protein